ncbi:MAG: formate dehydrogenase accessory sulfurtransferase FdhD [Ramlibacter sp.]|nr:formate dehydrogenase accessory sulfurtransferase FdhD [Ramlibacter sp.]
MHPKDAPLHPLAGTRSVAVSGRRAGRVYEAQDCVAEEVPVALEFNGISHAVMLASPVDLEDFALGFALTEGIVQAASEVHDIDLLSSPQGMTVQLRIASARFAALKERRRTLAGRTGCGLCGTESLGDAVRAPAPLQTPVRFAASAVTAALQALRSRQALHEATGATHAAGWARASGELALAREDVGRHNALDKLVGALMRERLPAGDGFIVITSRASYEMVGKTARAGVALLAAVSGVTGLAVDVASQARVALAGFARGQDLTLYAHPQRLLWNDRHGQ